MSTSDYLNFRKIVKKFTSFLNILIFFVHRFHTAAIVDGETYALATGTSKKSAKKAAAIMTLRNMYDKGMEHLTVANQTVVCIQLGVNQ